MSVNPALAKIHGYDSPEEMVLTVTDIAHQLYVDPSRRAVKDTNGEILYYEGMLQDITSRKFTAEEIGNLRNSLMGIISAMSSMTEIRDPGTSGH